MDQIDTATNSKLVRSMVAAALDSIEFGIGVLTEVPEPLDAEMVTEFGISAEDFDELTEHLLGGPRPDEHLGDPATAADVAAQRRIHEILTTNFPRALVCGEEADYDANLAAEVAPPGTLLFVVDALDGSEHQECFGFGFSTNILALQTTSRGARPLATLVVNSSRHCLGYSRDGGPFYGAVGDYHSFEDFNRPCAEDSTVVAVVAAKPKSPYREAAQRLFASTDFRIYTTGGSPMGPGMAMGRLDALVHPSAHPVWDAPHLPPLRRLGAFTLRLDTGDFVTDEELLDILATRSYLKDSGAKSVVPPHIVARDPSIAREIYEIIVGS